MKFKLIRSQTTMVRPVKASWQKKEKRKTTEGAEDQHRSRYALEKLFEDVGDAGFFRGRQLRQDLGRRRRTRLVVFLWTRHFVNDKG
jgi:hypothetical protein